MKKIKNAIVVVIFLSAFLCACHENYANASAENSSGASVSSSEYTTGSAGDTAELS